MRRTHYGRVALVDKIVFVEQNFTQVYVSGKNIFCLAGVAPLTVTSTNVSIGAPARRTTTRSFRFPRNFMPFIFLFTCMQSRTASIFNIYCFYCLHNLNNQRLCWIMNAKSLQIVQRRWRRMRRRPNLYRQQLPRPNGSCFEIHFGNRVIATQNDGGYLFQLHHPKRSGGKNVSRNYQFSFKAMFDISKRFLTFCDILARSRARQFQVARIFEHFVYTAHFCNWLTHRSH